MVARPRRKRIISLSTWGLRGTAGLVEEWESRRPDQEENQQLRRHTTGTSKKSTDSAADSED